MDADAGRLHKFLWGEANESAEGGDVLRRIKLASDDSFTLPPRNGVFEVLDCNSAGTGGRGGGMA